MASSAPVSAAPIAEHPAARPAAPARPAPSTSTATSAQDHARLLDGRLRMVETALLWEAPSGGETVIQSALSASLDELELFFSSVSSNKKRKVADQVRKLRETTEDVERHVEARLAEFANRSTLDEGTLE